MIKSHVRHVTFELVIQDFELCRNMRSVTNARQQTSHGFEMTVARGGHGRKSSLRGGGFLRKLGTKPINNWPAGIRYRVISGELPHECGRWGTTEAAPPGPYA